MAVDLETSHLVVFGDSRRMPELGDETVHLVVTSPPYPMVEMWDDLYPRAQSGGRSHPGQAGGRVGRGSDRRVG